MKGAIFSSVSVFHERHMTKEGRSGSSTARLRLAEAVVTVTPWEGADAEDINRMALDMVFIVERELLDR